jgi:hypothetical protein
MIIGRRESFQHHHPHIHGTSFHCLSISDFNHPKYEWLNGTSLSSYYRNKIKENYIYAASCFLGLCRTTLLPNTALLVLAFTKTNDISVLITSYLIVVPDNYSPLVLHFKLTLEC